METKRDLLLTKKGEPAMSNKDLMDAVSGILDVTDFQAMMQWGNAGSGHPLNQIGIEVYLVTKREIPIMRIFVYGCSLLCDAFHYAERAHRDDVFLWLMEDATLEDLENLHEMIAAGHIHKPTIQKEVHYASQS